MTKGAGNIIGDRISRCVRAPFRALSRARDFYIRSMTGCAGRMHYSTTAAPVSYPSLAGGTMSRSSSGYSGGRLSSSGDEDLIELIRAASQSRARAAADKEGSVQRSQSVASVRIDEDAPYEFAGDVNVGKSLMFPRSRSYAIGGKTPASTTAWKYK